MRAALLATCLAASLASTASAAPAVHADSEVRSPIDVVVAVNHPFMWSGKTSLAGSAYLGFAQHHAIRLNVASYQPGIGDGIASIPAVLSGDDDGDGPIRSGRTTDLGISYLYFPNALWRQLFAEVGVMRREIHSYSEGEYQSPEIQQTDAIGYAARLHVGWSWLFSNHVFMAAAVGLSCGRYVGSESTQQVAYDPMSPTTNVTYNHYEVAPEGYLRFGFRFGI